MSISISTYQHNIEHFFNEKLSEIDFFLDALTNNYVLYKSTPIPRDIKHLYISNFLFSAILNALFSQWEIVKLTIQLENHINAKEINAGLVGDHKLESKLFHFNDYFKPTITDSFEWFKFLKNARNASSHDGTITLNGGSGDEFRFSSDICRYKFDKDSKTFILMSADCPSGCAVTAIITMCLILIPLFEKKLKTLNSPDLSMSEIIKENIKLSKFMPPEMMKLVLASIDDKLLNCLDNIETTINVEKFSSKYKKTLDSKFVSN